MDKMRWSSFFKTFSLALQNKHPFRQVTWRVVNFVICIRQTIGRGMDLLSFPSQLWGHYQTCPVSQQYLVTSAIYSISDVCKCFTISGESSLGWAWSRGSGSKLSCAMPVWPCWESPPSPIPLGQTEHRCLLSLHALLHSTGLRTCRPQRSWDPGPPPCNRTRQVRAGISLPWLSWGDSLYLTQQHWNPALQDCCGLDFPIHHNYFCPQFSSAVIRKGFSKAGGWVGLSHNQGSELQTKFQAGLCFILSYLPSASFSFKLATINIFSSPITLGISFISME